jgi:hypothetical protein
MPVTDLWPEFKAPEAVNSPVFLLKEQAEKLRQKTGGLVLAELRSASEADGSFWVGFDLCSPALGEYTYRLLVVTYPPQFIPITLTAENETKTAQSLPEFQKNLEAVLRSAHTRQIVEAIMAQATALGASSRKIDN